MPARRTLLIILAALPFLLTTTGLSTAQTPPSDELWIESESDCDTEGSHCVITGAFIGSTVCRPGGLDDCVIQWGCSVTATLSAPNSDGERFAPLATRTARVVGGVDGCYIKQRVGPGTPWATAPVLDELKGSAVSGGVLRRITTKDHVDLDNDGAQLLICRIGGAMWSDGAEFTTTATPTENDHCSLGIDVVTRTLENVDT